MQFQRRDAHSYGQRVQTHQPNKSWRQGIGVREETGTTDYYAVEQVWQHDDAIIEYVTIDGETITTTPEHPFFTKERGWVAAGMLWRGAKIRKTDGTYAVNEFQKKVPRRYKI